MVYLSFPVVLIDWECHLQSSNILPPSSPPGFACYIVLHGGCPSIKHGQDSGALLSRDVCALSTLLPTPKSCQSQWPPGALASLVNKGPMSAMAFLCTFFFFGVGLSNYRVVYANIEGALSASSGGSAFIRKPFYFLNRICQTYSFLFRQLTFHLSCSRNSSLWGLLILYLKYSKAEGKRCLQCLH